MATRQLSGDTTVNDLELEGLLLLGAYKKVTRRNWLATSLMTSCHVTRWRHSNDANGWRSARMRPREVPLPPRKMGRGGGVNPKMGSQDPLLMLLVHSFYQNFWRIKMYILPMLWTGRLEIGWSGSVGGLVIDAASTGNQRYQSADRHVWLFTSNVEHSVHICILNESAR